eukprot:3556689-Rhodomonas_salina.1
MLMPTRAPRCCSCSRPPLRQPRAAPSTASLRDGARIALLRIAAQADAHPARPTAEPTHPPQNPHTRRRTRTPRREKAKALQSNKHAALSVLRTRAVGLRALGGATSSAKSEKAQASWESPE